MTDYSCQAEADYYQEPPPPEEPNYIEEMAIKYDIPIGDLESLIADERKKVIEEIEETLKGLDCGFCNYEDEVKIRLNQLKEDK